MSFLQSTILVLSALLLTCSSLVSSQSAGPYGYVTYHSYSADQSTSTVSCSDGANGLIAKGYTSLASLYPNVGATSFITWNSPQCGSCWTLTNTANGASVSITAIDGCGSVGGYTAHFDIAPEAFQQLGGAQGTADGHVVVTYSQC